MSIQEAKAHSFFKSIDWFDLLLKRSTPPYVPSLTGDIDVSNIDIVSSII